MRKYIIIFLIASAALSFLYYISYIGFLLNKETSEYKVQQEDNELQPEAESALDDTTNQQTKEQDETQTEEPVEDVSSVSETISEETKILIYNHYIDNNITTEEIIFANNDIVGLSRGEFSDYLNRNILGAASGDSGKELMSTEVLSFSSDEVTIRNNYMGLFESETFMLKSVDNLIVVYEADSQTIREKTNIIVDLLPIELQEELYNGKIIYGEDELNRFLENYSS